MFIINIFSKVNKSIARKVKHEEPGLYLYLTFPIIVTFLATFLVARVISHTAPWLFLTIGPGLHVHHFAYGFFVLMISGYLALIFNGPRATYSIALLHGVGLGLAFDEFGMWLHLRDDAITRWNYDGFLIVVGVVILIISAKTGMRALKAIFPFKKFLA